MLFWPPCPAYRACDARTEAQYCRRPRVFSVEAPLSIVRTGDLFFFLHESGRALVQAVQTATDSSRNAQAVARDVAASGSTREAGAKLWLAGRKLSDSTAATALARTLVCAYFLNLCIDDLEMWR